MSAKKSYPISDWRFEVANGDTRLGYDEWVKHKMEADGGARDPMCCPWCAAGSGLLLEPGRPSEIGRNAQTCGEDEDDMTPLSEYKCHNGDCGKSFWV